MKWLRISCRPLFEADLHGFYPVTVAPSDLITGCLINLLISGQRGHVTCLYQSRPFMGTTLTHELFLPMEYADSLHFYYQDRKITYFPILFYPVL